MRMQKTLKLLKALPKVVVSLAAVLAIGFGASEALAEDVATACMYDPPAQLGECISQEYCNTLCRQQPGAVDGTFGVCYPDGCCSCFL